MKLPEPDGRFYIYKFWIKGYDEYYIGATMNPKKRIGQHRGKVYRMALPMFWGRKIRYDTKEPFHIRFTQLLIKGKGILKIDERLYASILWKILKVVDTVEEARKWEGHYINQEGCINKCRFSTYYSRTKKDHTNGGLLNELGDHLGTLG